MACTCASTLNAKLKEQNLELNLSFVFDGPRACSYPTMTTSFIEKVRGKKPPVVFPTFCPFCGVKYEAEAVAE